jgi:hypothetical protein
LAPLTAIVPLVAAIIAIWAVLLAAAYLSRMVFGFGPARSAVVVAGSYAVLSALVLAWLGLNRTGVIAASGMLVPCAVALWLATAAPGRAGPLGPTR